MTELVAAALISWLVVAGLSLLTWLRARARASGQVVERPSVLTAVLALMVLGTAAVAALAGASGPVSPDWTWLVIAVAAVATLFTGGSVASCVLGLSDPSTQPQALLAPRLVLRGGAWIGALERLALMGTLLAGWPEGVAAIIAVKGLARYPELQAAPASGATERFIIGTLASLGWAAACAGITTLLIGGDR